MLSNIEISCMPAAKYWKQRERERESEREFTAIRSWLLSNNYCYLISIVNYNHTLVTAYQILSDAGWYGMSTIHYYQVLNILLQNWIMLRLFPWLQLHGWELFAHCLDKAHSRGQYGGLREAGYREPLPRLLTQHAAYFSMTIDSPARLCKNESSWSLQGQMGILGHLELEASGGLGSEDTLTLWKLTIRRAGSGVGLSPDSDHDSALP